MSRKPEPCPNLADHTPEPSGYVAWRAWATEMEKTHIQARCPRCRLFVIWLPKDATTPAASCGETGETL